MGRREIDGQAREGEKAGRNSSQCRKRGKNFWNKARKFTRRRNVVAASLCRGVFVKLGSTGCQPVGSRILPKRTFPIRPRNFRNGYANACVSYTTGMPANSLITVDPEILGGTPVFTGTRCR